MPPSKRDEAREERIAMEVIVDCYNEHEAWSGWWCYLDNRLAFPFETRCCRSRRGSPLKVGERVTVTGMLEDGSGSNALPEMQVTIDWHGRKLGVPLAQVVGVGVSEATAEAIADWHYWVASGRQF